MTHPMTHTVNVAIPTVKPCPLTLRQLPLRTNGAFSLTPSSMSSDGSATFTSFFAFGFLYPSFASSGFHASPCCSQNCALLCILNLLQCLGFASVPSPLAPSQHPESKTKQPSRTGPFYWPAPQHVKDVGRGGVGSVLFSLLCAAS
eukprot:19528_4